MRVAGKFIVILFLLTVLLSQTAFAAIESSQPIEGISSAMNADILKLKDCYIYPLQSNSKLKWNVELEGIAPNRSRLEWSITDKNSKVIGKGIEFIYGNLITWESVTFNMKPWSDKEPNLYQVEIKLITNDGVVDTIRQPFGMRSLVRDGVGLKLNGKPIMLRGTDAFSIKPAKDYLSELDNARLKLSIIKKLGFNWIRNNKKIPSEVYMQAADEVGIMYQVEATGAYSLEEWAKGMIACRKHPSVVLYCPGNEETIDEAKIEYLRSIAIQQKVLVPDGLFNPQEAMPGVEYRFDIQSLHPEDIVYYPFIHNAPRLAALKEFSDVFGNYSWGWLSYSPIYGDRKDLDKRMSIYERPLLSHETGISGSYIDLSSENKYKIKADVPKMYAIGRSQLTKAGLLDKADTYYKNSCAWQLLTRKYNTEMIRKCKYMNGYDMMNAADITTYRDGFQCGLMNEFFELKPGNKVEDILKFNGESVVLLDCYTYRNLLAGEKVSYDAMSSLYGDKPIKEGQLEWSLTDGKSAYSHGTINLSNVDIGKVEKIGAINFTAPIVKRPVKLTLKVRLSGGEYNLVNDWDFWVFPSVDAGKIDAGVELAVLRKYSMPYTAFRDMRESTSNLRVVSTLDDYILKHLEVGGNVVLLGSGNFPALKTTFQLRSGDQPNGNFATVITKHPALSNFPNNGYCDWQFFTMMEGGSAVTFNNPNITFDPIIEVVSSYKDIIKQASLFEFNVGKGKLLVCSMNLNPSDPGGNYLMHSILSYASGNAFKPRNSITMEQLKQLIGKGNMTQDVSGTDMADERHLLPKNSN